MRRAIAPALAVAAVVVASSISSGTALAATEAPSLVSAGLGGSGRWITDPNGRVLIVHGVNMPSKWLPAYPSALNFGDDDAALLARLGFNAVRITAERYAVKPTAGNFDAAYVGHLAETVRTLHAHGIYTLIDFHQDSYGPVFFDNGYPDWMTVTDGLPNLREVGFPLQYLLNPALNRAFDHLWANDLGPSGRPLQTDDAEILGYVAAGLRDEPGLLGYEIINEPWPGSVYPTCMNPVTGCPAFDAGLFSDYYGRMVPAIRSADPDRIIWYEPHAMFNQGVPTSVVPPDDPNLGFAFHVYNLCVAGDPPLPGAGRPCRSEDETVLQNALSHVASSGNPLLMTEFGATMDASTIADQVDQYDESMMPWMFWSYTRYMVRLASDGTLLPATDANVNWPLVDALTRPYPRLVAGTPVSWGFDPVSRVFRMQYSTARADGGGMFPAGSETEVAVPARSYPDGYAAEVEGGTVVSAPGAPLLRVVTCQGATTVTLRLAPGSGLDASC